MTGYQVIGELSDLILKIRNRDINENKVEELTNQYKKILDQETKQINEELDYYLKKIDKFLKPYTNETLKRLPDCIKNMSKTYVQGLTINLITLYEDMIEEVEEQEYIMTDLIDNLFAFTVEHMDKLADYYFDTALSTKNEVTNFIEDVLNNGLYQLESLISNGMDDLISSENDDDFIELEAAKNAYQLVNRNVKKFLTEHKIDNNDGGSLINEWSRLKDCLNLIIEVSNITIRICDLHDKLHSDYDDAYDAIERLGIIDEPE